MNKEQLATRLDGSEYPLEMSKELIAEAKANGLVIVYGASDDLMEFDGAIHDEAGAYDGDAIRFDKDGPLESWESLDKDSEEDVESYFRRKANVKTITPLWAKGEYSWQYETDIPHATFEVLEDDEKYCRGIVFSLADL